MKFVLLVSAWMHTWRTGEWRPRRWFRQLQELLVTFRAKILGVRNVAVAIAHVLPWARFESDLRTDGTSHRVVGPDMRVTLEVAD